MEDDTRSVDERYEELLIEHERVAGERDDLESKLRTMARILARAQEDPDYYQWCAVRGCDERPQYDVTTLPLCFGHFIRASIEYRRYDAGRPPYDGPVPVESKEKQPAVYYIAMTDHIKIGTTSNLRKRLQTFCCHADAVLAIEPGGFARERQRHVQFASLRVARSELFTPAEALMAHIAEARAMFGDPKQYM